MSRRLRRFTAPALVDRYIHDDRTGLHFRHGLARDDLWGARSRDQHRADHQIGIDKGAFDRRLRGGTSCDAPADTNRRALASGQDPN